MFAFSSIEQYQTALQEQRTSCVRAVTHYLEQIEQFSRLNAFVDVFREEALARAAALDKKAAAGEPKGKLFGVVVGLKDVICYKDHPVTASSAILEGFQSLYSATAVARMTAEDAIIIGTLNCDEFAMGSSNENSVYGPVRNADDETRVPGGSSGGSAVAVQAGLCMVALGSDTGGSVRQPADFCGVVGLKPTYGRVSRYGLIAYASSFDQIGIFSRAVKDAALVLEVIAGSDNYDSTVSHHPVEGYSSLLSEETDRKYRFAWFPEALEHPSLDPEIADGIRKTIDRLTSEGHTATPVQFDYLDFIVPAYYVLTTAEASSNLSRYDGVKYGYRTPEPGVELTEFYKETRSQGFGAEVKRRIMLGTFVLSTGYYDAYFTRAQQVRRLIRDRIDMIFNDFDAILLPTTPSTAFRLGEKTKNPVDMYLADIYTVMANLAGIPAISVPLFRHSNGMAFGIQAMTNRFRELYLLRVARLLLGNE